jgi:uncharacterized MAPEG superfamily protein
MKGKMSGRGLYLIILLILLILVFVLFYLMGKTLIDKLFFGGL